MNDAAAGAGLFEDRRNAGPATRARYEFQDACVALRCVQNLDPASPVTEVVVEWATDYVLVSDDGRFEFVSVKHRDDGQGDWTLGRLKAENVFRDLHHIWRAMGEVGDYVFESNHGIDRTAAAYLGDIGDDRPLDTGAIDALARSLGIDGDEAARFMAHLYLRRKALPSRDHIDAVGTEQLASVMQRLGLDRSRARACFIAIKNRIATLSTDRPLDPDALLDQRVGFAREVASRESKAVADRTLSMDVVRQLVEKTAEGPYAAIPLINDADPLFVGRERELVELARALRPGGADVVAPVVLTGLTGIGKTAIALRFATDHASQLHAHRISAASRQSLVSDVHALAGSVPDLADAGRDPSHRPPAVGGVILPDRADLLIIVDGLTDPAVLDGILPSRSHTRIIVTATSSYIREAFHHIPVGALDHDASLSYLRMVLPDADAAGLGRIADVIGGHALSLVQAGSLCRSESFTPDAYLRRFQISPATMLDLGKASAHLQPTRASFDAAIDAAVGIDSAAGSLITVMSYLAPEQVPEDLFATMPIFIEPPEPEAATVDWTGDEMGEVISQLVQLHDPFALDRAVAALHRYSLITREPSGIRIHPLIQAIGRARVATGLTASWIEAILGVLLAELHDLDMPQDDSPRWPAHLAAIADHATTMHTDRYALFAAQVWLGNRNYYYGAYDLAQLYHERALSLAREHGFGVSEVLSCLEHLANDYRLAGMTDAALAAIDERIAAAQILGDLDEVQRARVTRPQTLAFACRFPEASMAYAELVASQAGETLPARIQIFQLSLLADIERGQGHPIAALDAVRQAITVVDQVDDEHHRLDHATALHAQAARLLRHLGRHEEAIAHLGLAVDAARSFDSVSMIATQLHALASGLLEANLLDRARDAIAEGLALAEAFGEGRPLHAGLLQTKGRLELQLGNLDTAAQLLTQSMSALQSGGEPYRVDLACSYFNLGMVHAAQGRFDSAAALYQQARDLDAAVYGEDHGELIVDELELAKALGNAGNLAAAQAAINRCLAIIRSGAANGRRYRDDALTTAVLIDLAGA